MICLKQYSLLSLVLVGVLILSACNMNQVDGTHGAITLGDSATIVTETDSQYLEDAVTDLNDTVFEEEVLVVDKDTFNNVAAAQQLAKQQVQDSIAAAKAAEVKKKEAEKEAAESKKKTKAKEDKKKAASKKDKKKLTAKERRALEKKEQEKNKRR